MKKIFIINPVSGKLCYDEVSNKILKLCNDARIIRTSKVGDATEIASSFKMEEDTVVYSVGGDGTLNEVINGIAGGKCYLGIIPLGSGNDFYKSLKNSYDSICKIDLGVINNRYFINVASCGFDAIVNKSAIDSQIEGRKKNYIKAVFKSFKEFKPLKLKVNIDGKSYDGMYTLIAICNGKYYGNGLKIAPFASFDDDYFDIYMGKKVNKFKLIFLFIKMILSKHEESKSVKKIIANNIKIESDTNMVINIDGEVIIDKVMNITMFKDSMRIYNDKNIVDSIINGDK